MRRSRFADATDVRRFEAEWRHETGARLMEDSPFRQLLSAAEHDPARLAICFISDATQSGASRNVSFGELRGLFFLAANSLHALGAQPDRAIAYLVTNTPESLALIWGGTAAGIVAPINHYLEPQLLGAMLARLGAQILVTDADGEGVLSWAKVAAAVATSGCVRTVLHLGPTPRAPIPGVDLMSWERACWGLPRDRLVSGREISGGDIAAYFHTGGTTGMPKFACHTHGAQALAARVSGFAMGVDSTQRLIAGMPIFHAGGLMGCGLVPLAHGASIVQTTALGYRGAEVMSRLWEITTRHEVTTLVGPPTVYARLCEMPLAEGAPGTVRNAISSAAGLPQEIHRRFEHHTGVPLREVYGLTEATLLVAGTPPDGPPRIGSVGIQLPFVELRTYEVSSAPGKRRETAVGEIGAVAVRSPMVMPGYLGDSKASLEAMSGEWLDTGDLGRIDDEGYLHLTGRRKDLIIRGGHNIDPSMIEEALATHPGVLGCAAVGMPDADAGEVPIAYVVQRPGADVTEADLSRFAREKIPERAAVPRLIVSLPQLPLTSVGKISKVELRRDAAGRAAQAVLSDLLNAGSLSSVQVVAGTASAAHIVVVAPIVTDALRAEVKMRLGALNLEWHFESVEGRS